MSFKSVLLSCAITLVPVVAFAEPVNPPVVASNANQRASAVPPEGSDEARENVVVTAQRSAKTIPGDAVPEVSLGPAELRALGASNVAEILASLGPRAGTGRGRGGGQPVVLLNGRRVSGFREVAQLPAEAILRVEVFPEATALQYGFNADQRVVNIILRDRFKAFTGEATLGTAAQGERHSAKAELGYLRVTAKGRISANLELNQANSVTETQAGIVRTAGLNDGDFRTILPQTRGTSGSVTFNNSLGEGPGKIIGMTLDARFDNTSSDSQLGAVPLQGGQTVQRILARMNESTNYRLASTFDGTTRGWQWTATGTYDNSVSNTQTESIVGASQTSNSNLKVFEAVGNGSGVLANGAAGPIRGSFRIGYQDRQLESVSARGGVTTRGALQRGETNVRGTLTLPLTSRRKNFGAALGDVSLNLNGTLTDLSDFGGLQSTGVGLNWSPISDLRLSLTFDQAQAAPTVQQLGGPALATPNASVFDFARGQSVFITRISGGNSNLKRESRADTNISVNYAPTKYEGLDISLSYARQTAQNTLASFPFLTPALESAFPTRFTRDTNGQLLSIDQRPINFAANQNELIRYGFSYSKAFGKPLTRPPGALGTGGGSGGGRSVGEGRGPGGGGGFGGPGGFGGFGGGQPGRWSLSVYHTVRLDETITLAQGFAPIDLLDGGAIDDTGGVRRNVIEFEGGAAFFGSGFRLQGSWRGPTRIAGTPNGLGGSSDLFFDDTFTANLRVFLSAPPRAGLIPNVKIPNWLLRSRLILRVDNLTDSVQKVRNSNGVTPEAYQRGYIAPRGRFIEASWRKQF